MWHQYLCVHTTHRPSRDVAQSFIFTGDITKFLSGCIPPALSPTRQNWCNKIIGTHRYPQEFFCLLSCDAKKVSGWIARDLPLWLFSTKLSYLSSPVHFHKFGNVLFCKRFVLTRIVALQKAYFLLYFKFTYRKRLLRIS